MNDQHIALLTALRDSRLDTQAKTSRLRSIYSRFIDFVDQTNALRSRERRDLEKFLSAEELLWYDLKPLEILHPGFEDLAQISVEYAIRDGRSILHPMLSYRLECRKKYEMFTRMRYQNFCDVLTDMIGEELESDPNDALIQVTKKAIPHLEQEIVLSRLAECKGLFLTLYSNPVFSKVYHDFSMGEVLSASSALRAKAYEHQLEFMKLHVAASRWSGLSHHPADSKRFHDYCLIEARKSGFSDIFHFANFARDTKKQVPYFPKLYDFFEQQRRV